MHGRVKVRTTEEQREIAKREKQKKADVYKETMSKILKKRLNGVHDVETLTLISSLLTGNPDILTLWNYRREIFLNLKNEENFEEYQKILENDLNLTEQCLKVNPKSYGSWHHRIWILDNLPNPNWERELKLCTRYLELDERNFHCWDFRRTLTERSNVPDILEYDYTLVKIEANFSNYSAWHLRSKLLPKIFPDPHKKFPINEVKQKEELELVENAAFTDPYDQSAWFYLRWLLGLTEPKISFVFLDINEEILVITSKSISINELTFGTNITVKINNELAKGTWHSINNLSCSNAWKFMPDIQIQSNDSLTVQLQYDKMTHCTQQMQAKSSIANAPNFFPTFSSNLEEALAIQLSSCQQLLELEPESKWTQLTIIFLMLYLKKPEHKPDILDALDKLIKVDPLRRGYYNDLRSKILIQWAIMAQYEQESFTLTGKHLSAFYHAQYLYKYKEIDLSENNLTSESLIHFYVLINCCSLNLSRNKITDLKTLPVMHKLEILNLNGNLINEIDYSDILKFQNLKQIILTDNPILKKTDSVKMLADKLGSVKISYNEDV